MRSFSPEPKILKTIQPVKQLFKSKPVSLKFMFSKKATKIDEIFTVDWTFCEDHYKPF